MPEPFEPEKLTDRELYETADGMRHWWNDDNPDEEQLAAYNALSVLAQAAGDLEQLDPDEVARVEAWERYIMDLEACVAEMYRRYEARDPEPKCVHCEDPAYEHFCIGLDERFTVPA